MDSLAEGKVGGSNVSRLTPEGRMVLLQTPTHLRGRDALIVDLTRDQGKIQCASGRQHFRNSTTLTYADTLLNSLSL